MSDVDGRPVEVGPAKAQVALAPLALSVGVPVPVARLVDAMWGTTLPAPPSAPSSPTWPGRCFADGVEIELPPRTHTPSEPLRARAAFRRGDHARAFRILRDHVDELLVTDNMQAGMVDCIEFVTMMTASGRVHEAARVLAHLETGNLLDTPGWRSLVADSAATIAEHGAGRDAVAPGDDRAALQLIRTVLDRALDPD